MHGYLKPFQLLSVVHFDRLPTKFWSLGSIFLSLCYMPYTPVPTYVQFAFLFHRFRNG